MKEGQAMKQLLLTSTAKKAQRQIHYLEKQLAVWIGQSRSTQLQQHPWRGKNQLSRAVGRCVCLLTAPSPCPILKYLEKENEVRQLPGFSQPMAGPSVSPTR